MAFIPQGQAGLAQALAMMQQPGGAPPQQQFQAQQQLPQPMQPPAAGYVDPSTIQRRQQLADMLRANAQRGGNPRTGMEAIGNLAQTLSAAWIDRKANKATEQNEAYRQSALADALAESDPVMRARKLAASRDPELQRMGVAGQFEAEQSRAASEAEERRYQRQLQDSIANREDQQAFQAQTAAENRRYQQQSAAEQRAFQAEQNRLARESAAELARVKTANTRPGGMPKLTEGQAKFATFANIANEAQKRLSRLETTDGFNASMVMDDKANVLRNDNGREYIAAKRTFIDAIIRPMTGAAVTKEEFSAADQRYFPKLGDTPETIKVKRDLRENAIRSIIAGSHGGYEAIYGAAENVGAAPRTGSKISIEDFLGGQ